MRTCLFVLAASAVLSGASSSKPDFSGTWKMNPAKSSFGAMPAPAKYERHIDHKEPVIQMTTVQATAKGEQRLDSTLRTDGVETTNHFQSGDARSTGKWVGATLEIETNRDTPAGAVSTRDSWSLSEDGRTLTTATHLTTPQGAFDFKVVFEKQ
ncbi:MAG TPA: hypothetical protein VKU01_27695 [Bryobacteraceae bacterium]|nr:hypothetical protein [Bryobacteraceae bacterium]